MKRKTLIPNDIGDMFRLISFIGFFGIFLAFTFGFTWINDNTTSIFLIISGAMFLIVGKVVTVKKWIKDGVQQNEFSMLIALVFGISSIIIGLLILFDIDLIKFYTYIGILALVPALYTLIDYVAKNSKK